MLLFYSESELLVSACSVAIRSLYSGHWFTKRSASRQPIKVDVEKQFSLKSKFTIINKRYTYLEGKVEKF